MSSLEKHIKRAPSLKSKASMTKGYMTDKGATEGMKKQMDYSANAGKKGDNTPAKMAPGGKGCK